MNKGEGVRNKEKGVRNKEGGRSFGFAFLVEIFGEKQKMSCSNTEGIFRIIQSIPSKKAEPFKRWLAKVGSDRMTECRHLKLGADGKIYKVRSSDNFDIFPGDPHGSPDEFFSWRFYG